MRRYRDSDWLERQYWQEGRTQREIAEECGVAPRTIRKYMDRFDIDTREIAGENHPLHGAERSQAVRNSISDTLTGREYREEWRERLSEALTGRTIPGEVREKISQSLTGLSRSEATRRRMSLARAGEANPNWRGGYRYRYGPEWGVVRDRVRERDEVCRHCGHDGSELRLEVHHVVPVRKFRQAEDVSLAVAHDESNLILLCNRCHGLADHGKLGFESGLDDPTDG